MIRFLLVFVSFLLLFSCSSAKQSDHTPMPEEHSAAVKVGAEVLLENHLDELTGKRVGLVMNPTARVHGTHMLDLLVKRGVNVTALFAPEHGFRGEAGAGETIEDGIDQATGLPVYSLYGDTRKPTDEMLEKVDLLLFDMQDVGARFYTYNVTLGLVLEAAAANEVSVWVLDRPNPAGGDYVAGWILQDQYQSFVGAYPIPMAHGMTLGELAKMMIGEGWLQTASRPKLKVIPMQGWQRSMKWPDTGLDWYPPSPNLPTFEHAYMYLGTVLFEGTNISEGRGTVDPFLTIGSPYVDLPSTAIAKLREEYPALQIKRTRFTPQAIPGQAVNPKYEGQQSYGLRFYINDYDQFNPVKFGVHLLQVMIANSDNGRITDFIFKLAGSDNVKSYSTDWQDQVAQFREARQPYLIYE